MSEHNGLPPPKGGLDYFKTRHSLPAAPYDVSQTHAIRYSLTECTCSVLCACCLPAFGSRGGISPRGGAVMSTTRPHTCHMYDASGAISLRAQKPDILWLLLIPGHFEALQPI